MTVPVNCLVAIVCLSLHLRISTCRCLTLAIRLTPTCICVVLRHPTPNPSRRQLFHITHLCLTTVQIRTPQTRGRGCLPGDSQSQAHRFLFLCACGPQNDSTIPASCRASCARYSLGKLSQTLRLQRYFYHNKPRWNLASHTWFGRRTPTQFYRCGVSFHLIIAYADRRSSRMFDIGLSHLQACPKTYYLGANVRHSFQKSRSCMPCMAIPSVQ